MNENNIKSDSVSSSKNDTLLSEKELSKLDKIYMSKQIQILEYLWKILIPKTVSEYAKDNYISRQTVYEQLKNKKLPVIKLNNQTFIIS